MSLISTPGGTDVHLLMLSATPVETNLTELYNLVTLLRPGTLGTEAEFRRRFQNRADPLAPRQPLSPTLAR